MSMNIWVASVEAESRIRSEVEGELKVQEASELWERANRRHTQYGPKESRERDREETESEEYKEEQRWDPFGGGGCRVCVCVCVQEGLKEEEEVRPVRLDLPLSLWSRACLRDRRVWRLE